MTETAEDVAKDAIALGRKALAEHALWQGRILVAKIMGETPAARAYVDQELEAMQGRHLRAVASALGREYAYLSGSARDTARRVLEQVQTELQGRPNHCPECGEPLPAGHAPGRCFNCRALSTL